MQKWLPSREHSSELVEVRDTGSIGRGLFLTTEAHAGLCLGKFESIEIPAYESQIIEKTSLGAYVWEHKSKADWLLLPFGWINFINHSRFPNCAARWIETSSGWQIALYCLTDISEDAQLFIDYGCEDAELGFAPEPE
jgi:SET domain